MKPYKVEYLRGYEKDLSKLPRQTALRIIDASIALSENPRPAGCKKLSGFQRLYRTRIGDYRLVYSINDEEQLIVLIRVRHRKNVYDGLAE